MSAPPPPPPPATNFKSWKTHELQEYLLTHTRGAERARIPLIHLKFQLAKRAADVERQTGVRAERPPPPPPPPPSQGVRLGGRRRQFVHRNNEHHERMRQAQIEMYQRMARSGGNQHGHMYAHPQAQDVGFAHVDAGTSLMVGSVARAGYDNARNSLHQTVHGAPMPGGSLLQKKTHAGSADGKYRKPSVLVARAYRNWHSPRDHDEYKRRERLAAKRGTPMEHTQKVTEAMKLNEGFDFSAHPELDWPMYECCEVRLGRHCPECFVSNRCCRCLFDPCGEENKDHGGSDWAGHFGVGHDLYFKYLKLLGFTFLFMSLIMLPSMVINSYGDQPTDTTGLQLYHLSLGNLGAAGLNNDTIRLPCDLGPASVLYESSPSCEWDRPSYAWFYGFSDFIASVLFMVCFLWLKHYEKSEVKHFKELASFASVADYSIFVKQMPPDMQIDTVKAKEVLKETLRIEQMVRDFWEQQVRAEVRLNYGDDKIATLKENHIVDSTNQCVADVSLILDHGSDIHFFQKQKPLKKDIHRTEWHIKKMNFELAEEERKPSKPAGARYPSEDERNDKTIKRLRTAIGKAKLHKKKKVQRLQQIVKSRQDFHTLHNKVHKVVGAFVTFTTDMAKQLALERYPSSYLMFCCQSKEKRWHGTLEAESEHLNLDEKLMTRVRIKNAPEPTTLIWENMEYGWCSRLLRRLVSSLVALGLIFGSGFAVFYARTNSGLDEDVPLGCGSSPSYELFPGISCESYVTNATKMGLTETEQCVPVVAKYGRDKQGAVDIFNAEYTAGNVTAIAETCFCREYAYDPSYGLKVRGACGDFVLQAAAKLGYTILSSVVIVLINGIYVRVVRSLANFEKHHDIDSRDKSVSVRSMFGQFINTGLVYLIVNANINNNKFFSNYKDWKDANSVLQGAYDDFTPEWYAEVGQAITITMLMFAFTPHMLPFIMYARFHCRIRCCSHKAATQAELNQYYTPPQFHYSTRYAQISVSMLICMMYSTGIPFLYVVGCATAFLFYCVDKLLFSWLYGKPPQYDPSVNTAFTNILGWGLLLHVAFGTWMLGNKHILSSGAAVSTDTTAVGNQTSVAAESSILSYNADGTFRIRDDVASVGLTIFQADGLGDHLLQQHVVPMFALLIFMLACAVLNLTWSILGGFFGKLFHFVTCGRCCVAEPVFLKDDYEQMKPVIKLWGITSYNIFENPLYQLLFSVDEAFAEKHRHLEDLGDVDNVVQQSVALEMVATPGGVKVSM
jgi:hypothetical protein